MGEGGKDFLFLPLVKQGAALYYKGFNQVLSSLPMAHLGSRLTPQCTEDCLWPTQQQPLPHRDLGGLGHHGWQDLGFSEDTVWVMSEGHHIGISLPRLS